MAASSGTALNPASTSTISSAPRRRSSGLSSTITSSSPLQLPNSTVNPLASLFTGRPYRLPSSVIGAVPQPSNRRTTSSAQNRRTSSTSNVSISESAGSSEALLDISGRSSTSLALLGTAGGSTGSVAVASSSSVDGPGGGVGADNSRQWNNLSSMVQSISPLLPSTVIFQRAARRVIGSQNIGRISGNRRAPGLSTSTSVDSGTSERDDLLGLLTAMEEGAEEVAEGSHDKQKGAVNSKSGSTDAHVKSVILGQGVTNGTQGSSGDAAVGVGGQNGAAGEEANTSSGVTVKTGEGNMSSLKCTGNSDSQSDCKTENEDLEDKGGGSGGGVDDGEGSGKSRFLFSNFLSNLTGSSTGVSDKSESSQRSVNKSNSNVNNNSADGGNATVSINIDNNNINGENEESNATDAGTSDSSSANVDSDKNGKNTGDSSDRTGGNTGGGGGNGNSDGGGVVTTTSTTATAAADGATPTAGNEDNEEEDADEANDDDSSPDDPYWSSVLWQLPVLLVMLLGKFLQHYWIALMEVLVLVLVFYMFNMVVKRNVVSNRQMTIGWRQCCVKIAEGWKKKLRCRKRRLIMARASLANRGGGVEGGGSGSCGGGGGGTTGGAGVSDVSVGDTAAGGVEAVVGVGAQSSGAHPNVDEQKPSGSELCCTTKSSDPESIPGTEAATVVEGECVGATGGAGAAESAGVEASSTGGQVKDEFGDGESLRLRECEAHFQKLVSSSDVVDTDKTCATAEDRLDDQVVEDTHRRTTSPGASPPEDALQESSIEGSLPCVVINMPSPAVGREQIGATTTDGGGAEGVMAGAEDLATDEGVRAGGGAAEGVPLGSQSEEDQRAMESVQCVQERAQLLLLTLLLVPFVVFVFYCVIWREEAVYWSLLFLPPRVPPLLLPQLLWLCLVLDCLARLVTVWVKAVMCLGLMCRPRVTLLNKGKHYPLIEMISQLYRSLLPIHPWFIYIYASYDYHGQDVYGVASSSPHRSTLHITTPATSSVVVTTTSHVLSDEEDVGAVIGDDGGGGVTTVVYPFKVTKLEESSSFTTAHQLFGLMLFVAYLLQKRLDIVTRATNLWQSIRALRTNTGSYGTAPTKTELESSGGKCPICHDPYSCPTLLQCSHIFCEACIVQWFQRERICPMCRAQVADDPVWKDGATSQLPQVI